MIIGYARVSTRGQATNGNSLEDQINKLKLSGCEEVVYDVYTGTKLHRPELDKVLAKLESGDTLKVCKLDRFARSAKEATEIIDSLISRNVSIHVLNMGLIDTTSTGRLMMQILLAFAEFERDMIVERTQAGKEIAKGKPGFKEGRPKKYKQEQLDLAMTLLKDGKSYGAVEKMTGINRSTIYREAVKLGLIKRDIEV